MQAHLAWIWCFALLLMLQVCHDSCLKRLIQKRTLLVALTLFVSLAAPEHVAACDLSPGDGPALAARHCHCERCRRGRGAAHASNLVVAADTLRFTAGEDAIRRYKVPEAKYFTQSFCARCAGKVPMVDRERAIAVVPLGGLDDPSPIAPREHIWTADVPSWSGIHDALPQHEGPPA